MRYDLKPTAVNAILGEVRKVQSAGTSVISLMRGEPDFRTPTHIVEACTQSLASGRTTYPDNRGERVLRDAVSAKLARDNGVSYDPMSEVLVTTGATLGIYAALMATLRPGPRSASAAKAAVGKAARIVGQGAIQIHGGMGMTDELDVGHYFKRLTALEMLYGTTDHHLRRMMTPSGLRNFAVVLG